jgi:hypothetical protein
MRGHQVGQLRDQLGTAAETDLGLESILHRSQAQPFEPGDRRVERRTVLQTDVLHGRTAPQPKGITQQLRPPRILATTRPTDKAFEPHGIDGVGFHRQPVAVRLPADQPFRQCLPQPGSQALQGVRRVGRRVLTPDPVNQRRLLDHATRFEREGDQQRAQPGTRHLD